MSARKGSARLGLLLGVAAAVAIAGAFAASTLLRPVAEVVPVISGEAIDAKPGSVVVQPEYSMELKSAIGGRVLKANFNVEPGRPVKEGEILVQLDGTDLQLDIEQIEHDFEAAKQRVAVGSSIALELENARSDAANAERLYKLGQLSESDYQKQQRLLKQIEQRLALEKVANDQQLQTFDTTLKEKHRELEKMTVVAPFDGEVSAVYAHPGDLISNNAPIATLITTNRIVEAQISEEDFAGIRVGEKAAVIFIPYGNWVYNGSVTKILPTADAQTQRRLIHLQLTDIEPEKLAPGIPGEVSIVVGQRPARAIVPRRALFGDSLFVVDDGRVSLRRIKKGYVWLQGVEIIEGVSPGERVIVSDIDKFHEGERVAARELPSDALKSANP
jgi:RND family efflux transporter MFP subunit